MPPPQNGLVAPGSGPAHPVFLMGTSWDRHSWYLRLPCRPGILRVECSADIPTDGHFHWRTPRSPSYAPRQHRVQDPRGPPRASSRWGPRTRDAPPPGRSSPPQPRPEHRRRSPSVTFSFFPRRPRDEGYEPSSALGSLLDLVPTPSRVGLTRPHREAGTRATAEKVRRGMRCRSRCNQRDRMRTSMRRYGRGPQVPAPTALTCPAPWLPGPRSPGRCPRRGRTPGRSAK